MDPDLSIVLLGKSGVGKSSSGNSILGQAVFESRLSFKPVTTAICEKIGRVFGNKISVIDTPGILNSEDTEREVQSFCKELLQSSRPVLFLVVIRVGRFTKEDQEAVEAAIRVLGNQGLKKSYLLFTGGDTLKNMTLTEFIFEENEGSLPDVVMKFGGAYHLFNNEDGDNEQVRTLLIKAGYLRQAVVVDPVHQVERRIVLIGRPGAGKSSAGNTILGSERFKTGCGFNSVSTETVSETAEVKGRQVTVVDTPGFTNEALTPEQLYLQIMRSLVEASPGPHAFVIVVRVERISAGDKKLFELLPKLFGSDASKYIMVLFTHGDELRGRSMDDLIKSNTCVSELVSMCGGRFCVFDNTKRGNRQQVREFLRRVDDMVEANGGGHCTSEMFRMAETFIREERNLSHQSPESNSSSPKYKAWRRLLKFMLVGGLIGLGVGAVSGALLVYCGVNVAAGVSLWGVNAAVAVGGGTVTATAGAGAVTATATGGAAAASLTGILKGAVAGALTCGAAGTVVGAGVHVVMSKESEQQSSKKDN